MNRKYVCLLSKMVWLLNSVSQVAEYDLILLYIITTKEFAKIHINLKSKIYNSMKTYWYWNYYVSWLYFIKNNNLFTSNKFLIINKLN